jgi:alkanesulfonate monooxygenase SsuD/methylene tetrahydromethanopterin reductase-like flavin-dependent oxidoreductase (luciferase family)
MGFCYVGDTDDEALRIAEKICWFISVSLKQGTQFERFLPGQLAPEMAPRAWRGGRGRAPRDLSAESLIANGQLFAGNPDTVVRQVKQFRQRVGGLGRLIMMTRQGFVSHAEAQKSFSLAAREVLPQLAELDPVEEAELVGSRH